MKLKNEKMLKSDLSEILNFDEHYIEVLNLDDEIPNKENLPYLKKKHRKIFLISIPIFLLITISIGTFIYLKTWHLEVKSIKLLKYNLENDAINIEIEKNNDLIFSHEFNCIATSENLTISVNGKNNICHLMMPIGEDYEITLSNKLGKSISYSLKDYINESLSFEFLYDNIYLVVGEEEKITYKDVSLLEDEINYNFYSDNPEVATVVDGKIKGVGSGSTIIHESLSGEILNVVVTNLITIPTYKKEKDVVPCNYYSEDDNNTLDKFLEYDINKAGYQTRAGVVAAARFLTLKFPYRIPYFYENGRVSDTGVNYADGEGRYYHKGLYLNASRFSNIDASFSGPSIWGCPLCNWESDHWFGFYYGVNSPNGLDCSGFASWALLNGGFDPGDIGAGETEDAYQLTDLGEFVDLTEDILASGVIKSGDLFNYFGHISIIIGIKDGVYYVAESLPNFYGVDVRIYTGDELLKMFTHAVLMDSYYKEDGNYTEFWN